MIPSQFFSITDEDDARIFGNSTLIIGPQTNNVCINIEAVDDEIAEDAEFFNLTAMTSNSLDSVNGTTSIEIPANDGMISCKCSK